jgi:hypothetical protein
MRALGVELRRRWEYNGDPKKLVYGAVAVAGMVGVGEMAEHFDIVDRWYGAPFVLLVAVVSNRLNMRAGLLAAFLSVLSWNFLFDHQAALGHKWALSWPTTDELAIYISCILAAILLAKPRPPTALRAFDGGTNLPFTRAPDTNGDHTHGGLHSTGWIYWDVQPTGNWGYDADVGREYCRMWISRANHNELRPLLSWIVHDMIRSRRWSGVEAGFASALEAKVTRPAEERSQQSSV